MLGLPVTYGIVFFGLVTGAYTIYGGLKSAAWTDFMQILVLGAGGVLVPILGLRQVGGLAHLVREYPDKFQVFLPVTHERFPVTGVFTGFLTVGLWYSCTSQHIVQRVLAAKDEYNARMGVVGAGFLHIVTPFFFTVPGIIAFALYPKLPRGDAAYLTLVQNLIPTGLRGLILAAMAAALMSNLSSVLNSASTLVTIDFYKKFFRPDATETQQVRFGQLSGHLILLLGIAIALYLLDPEGPAVRPGPARLLLHRPAVRRHLHPRPALAAGQRDGRRRHGRSRVPVLGLPHALCLPALGVPEALQHLPAPRPGRVVLLHGGHDRHVAADRPAAAGEDRRHHLVGPRMPRCPRTSEPATRASRTGGSGGCCSSRTVLAIYGVLPLVPASNTR